MVSAWYRGSPWLKALKPVAYLFSQVAQRRRARLAAGAEGAAVPVVVIGNISLGGTGKTPLLIYLVRQLNAHGIRVGVISRGYGGSVGAGPVYVETTDDPAVVGDEPLMIRQSTNCPVVVGKNRVDALKYLVAQADIDLVLSDDGLQHYALARDLEIAVIDGSRGVGNGLVLPAGPLREPLSRLREVDFCLSNGPLTDAADVRVKAAVDGFFELTPKGWWPLLAGSENQKALTAQPGTVALAGIGNPTRFFNTVRNMGLEFEAIPLSDHAEVDAELLTRLAGQGKTRLLITSKDAVKWRALAYNRRLSESGQRLLDNTWVLEVDVAMQSELLSALLSRFKGISEPSLT